ncbi:beta-lactamase-like protein [Mycena leptocephala]|nr:beta-lactamase-like protein [Mycena leptocephala]
MKSSDINSTILFEPIRPRNTLKRPRAILLAATSLHRTLHAAHWHMAGPMTITFLGTCSGGGPNESRKCSSLIVDCLRDGSLWMVDCAEGTTRQFAFQPPDTPCLQDMHADHTMGVVTLLRNVLFAPSIDAPVNAPPRIEIYGPAGIRTFVRSILKMTLTHTADKYVVHELLRLEDAPTPCEPLERHPMLDDGFWRAFTQARGVFGDVVVDAGHILHRDPSLGFILREPDAPARKIVILGDTYDLSPIIPLCTAASLLIHEATDAHIPREIGPRNNRTPETVLHTALTRGHSIPRMAGEFAKTIGGEKLVLNHIGCRFPAPRRDRDLRMHVMREIERQATEAWGSGRYAMAAWDFMRVAVLAPDPAALTSQNSTKKRKRSHKNFT